jgi:hypothetical protein
VAIFIFSDCTWLGREDSNHDDLLSAIKGPEKGPTKLRASTQFRRGFSQMAKTPSRGSNPPTPGIRAGLAALVGRAACANCGSATILMGEVMLQQHETMRPWDPGGRFLLPAPGRFAIGE